MIRRARLRLLDEDRLVQARLVHGLSQRGLARPVGVSAPVVGRWERGVGHGEIPLWRLRALTEALGLPLTALFVEHEQVGGDPADAIKVEAALAASRTYLLTEELALGLSWPTTRVRQALRHLAARHAESGLALHRTANGWTIRARVGVLDQIEESALAAARRVRRGIRIDEARLLWRVLQQPLDSRWEQRAAQRERKLLATLLHDGLVERRDGVYSVSEQVRAALAFGLPADDGGMSA
jgi:transcriptional regulator with XRE-family HTH domain